MKMSIVAVVAALTSFAIGVPNLSARHVQHERRDLSQSVWIKRDAIEPTRLLPMRIGLTQTNLEHGHDLLMELSDPDSPKYGQHLSVEEVYDLFAPSSHSVAAVYAWLAEAGIALDRVSQSTNKQWVQFQAEAQEVEALLKSKFHFYEHETNGATGVGCDEYHVKADIQHHIDYITPGIKLIGVHDTAVKRLSRRSVAPGSRRPGPIKTPFPGKLSLQDDPNSLQYCDIYITPACIMAMYNITKGSTAVKGNELGVFEDGPNFLDQKDMNMFYKYLYPEIPKGTFPIVHEIDGAQNKNNPQKSGIEPLLDFQISYPIIWPQNSVLYLADTVYEYYRSPGFFNTFLDAIDGSYCTYTAYGETGNNNTVDPNYPSKGYDHPLQCGVFKPTNVISVSYGLGEYLYVITPNYQKRQCNEYMKLALQGVTFVFASGDNGVAAYQGCLGTYKKAPIFNPGFPNDCPYVTNVGSTTLVGSPTADNEKATTQFGSGGGFSNFFARPSWQESAVKSYFNSPDAPTYPYYTGSSFGNGFYNRSGRGFPDLAAIGQAILNFGDGTPYLVGGTSASAPVVAAIFNRINEERLKAGKSVIGFVNPTLYKNPQAFHDITRGDNPGCGTKGFNATKGWDPVTGLGTPNFPALLDVFMKLP